MEISFPQFPNTSPQLLETAKNIELTSMRKAYPLAISTKTVTFDFPLPRSKSGFIR